VRLFLEQEPRIFPWYLGINATLLGKAAAELHSSEALADTVKGLVKDGRLSRNDDGTLHYVQRNADLSLNLGTAG
jgi:hypothetical protein